MNDTIISVYRSIQIAFDNPHYRPQEEPFGDSPSDVIDRMVLLRDKNPEFFSSYDYSWVFCPASYTFPMEAYYQLSVLEILTEVHKTRPDVDLSNICVRVSFSANYYPECLVHGTLRYVILPFSLIKIFQEAAILLFEVLLPYFEENAGRLTEMSEAELLLYAFHSHVLETRLTQHYADLRDPLLRFIRVLNARSRFQMPYNGEVEQLRFFSDALREDSRGRGLKILLLELVLGAEAFAICHELAHLFEHSFANQERLYQEEFDADKSASSLFIIRNAVGDHLFHSASPALFFVIMKLSLGFRRRAMLVDHIKEIGEANEGDAETMLNQLSRVAEPEFFQAELTEERCLDYRILSYGLLDRMWKLSGLPECFFDEITEFSAIMAACECRYSEMMHDYMKQRGPIEGPTFWPDWPIQTWMANRLMGGDGIVDRIILDYLVNVSGEFPDEPLEVMELIRLLQDADPWVRYGLLRTAFVATHGETAQPRSAQTGRQVG